MPTYTSTAWMDSHRWDFSQFSYYFNNILNTYWKKKKKKDYNSFGAHQNDYRRGSLRLTGLNSRNLTREPKCGVQHAILPKIEMPNDNDNLRVKNSTENWQHHRRGARYTCEISRPADTIIHSRMDGLQRRNRSRVFWHVLINILT